jgi:hypothetical protein
MPRMLIARIAPGIAALLVAGCGARTSHTKPTVTVTAAPNTVTVTATASTPANPVLPTAAGSSKPNPGLRPGPRSAVADINLPEGTSQCPNNSCDNLFLDNPSATWEEWQYTVPFESVVTFLSNQFATGPRYDAYGATSWMGLPPCYYEHTSPPLGGYPGGDNSLYWFWAWGKGSRNLTVQVNDLKRTINISLDNNSREWNAKNCLRS